MSVNKKLRRTITRPAGDAMRRARGTLDTPWRRFLGHVELLFMDHGIFRALYVNRHRVGQKLYRSAQPAPHHVAWAARHGIRTIVNLRGAERDCAGYYFEIEACAHHGIRLVDFPIGSREAPSKARLEGARRLFETIEYPALIHCKSGADRAGFMAAFYLFVHEGRPLDEAMKQLSLRYGHVKQAKTGILDAFFDAYRAHNEKAPVAFWDWVEKHYDPAVLTDAFRSGKSMDFLVDTILRRE
jgi:uncharacterized protein (TIGR01244 family)